MRRVVTAEQMKASDAAAIQTMGMPGMVLMERAALGVVHALKKSSFSLQRVLVVCGMGNNGGDGLAVARLLHLSGIRTEIFEVGNPERRSESNTLQHSIAENYQVPFTEHPVFEEYSVIIDGIFGVGLSRDLSPDYVRLTEKINQSGAKVLAIDLPSGLNADTGYPMGTSVKADLTVTFAFEKPGLLFYPGADFAGKVCTADVGIYEHPSVAYLPSIFRLDKKDDLRYPKRAQNGNKGTFGKVLLIAGSRDMCGAAYLAGHAAYLTGAGMVKILTHVSNRSILLQQLPEAMLSCYEDDFSPEEVLSAVRWADVIGIGPGLGSSDTSGELLRFLLTSTDKPLVIDADGLNLLSRSPELLTDYPSECIITPHMGEMSRLTGLTVSEIAKNRLQTAGSFAAKHHCVCVLKDSRTLIALDDTHYFINTRGNSGMATAGSGDVLTGITLGLLAQIRDTRTTAPLAVRLHALAGDRAAGLYGEASLLAGNLLEALPYVLRSISRRLG
ncbi:MAG: NAD(P)H-hydrate dehydratase [Eubacteriales bacterium]|nr:NAD(P)H-hydrate dehydratase [Eubacteriales bacterium]